MIAEHRIEQILRRFEELEAAMAAGDLGGDEFTKVSKEYAELTPVARAAGSLKDLQQQLADAREMRADPEMRDLADAEAAELSDKVESAEQELKVLLLPRDEADERSAILEIRAGTGGEEAALFAGDLLKMYQRYAEAHGWRFEVMSLSESDMGGMREAVVSITGRGVFARLKYESGVHRVQRVPETEAQGRIHTSAATVAVLPEAEEIDVSIDPKDLRVDTYRSQGAGGQHVNTTDSAIRITHMPSGIVVACQDEKSQHKNRAKAMKILLARLYETEREARDTERAESRRSQVGSGDRSERIRTYNFPQNRITDHRVELTLYKLDKFITGEAVDEVVDALATEDQAQRLAALEAEGMA
ncbi:MAG: peptide chain release factor 1 [Alphaproteobacteria bacterium]